MIRFLTTLITLVSFSGNVIAATSTRNPILNRLGIDEAFLNSPICSVKKKGGALVRDFGSMPNDPAFRSKRVIFLNKKHNGDNDHGNLVSNTLSQLLPSGRTFLQVTEKLEDTHKNLTVAQGHPIVAINYSIAFQVNKESPTELLRIQARLYKDMLTLLRSGKILIYSAGNELAATGGTSDLKDFLFMKALSKLPHHLRQFVIYVGATKKKGGDEVLDSNYSNIAGKVSNQFILAPSDFPLFSPKAGFKMRKNGTSISAPVITALLTRALLANPHLNRTDVVRLLYQTANKRFLVSSGSAVIDKSLYGHGSVNARLFFNKAHELNRARKLKQNPSKVYAGLSHDNQGNVFRANKLSLKDNLEIFSHLKIYKANNSQDLKNYQAHLEKISRSIIQNIDLFNYRSITLDDFDSLSDVFKFRRVSDKRFTEFALSKFNLSHFNRQGLSFLTLAIKYKREHLVNALLRQKVNIHKRGLTEQKKLGAGPIDACIAIRNPILLRNLLKMGALINKSFYVDPFPHPFNPTTLAILKPVGIECRLSDHLKIIDILYHQGANFQQKYQGLSLIRIAELAYGVNSPITKRVKIYVNCKGSIKRKPIKRES